MAWMGLLLCVLTGCSSSGSLTEPASNESPAIDTAPGLNGETNAPGHNLLGFYSVSFDPVKEEFTVVPNRDAMTHYNVTPFLLPPNCDDCFNIELTGFSPEDNQLGALVTIKNPFQYTGFDVRGIFMHEQPGWIVSNDGYTSLFDDGGEITINPYQIFSENPFPKWLPPGTTGEKSYGIKFPPNPDLNNINYAVVAHWPGHCEDIRDLKVKSDPVTIDYDGGDVYVEVRMWDYQDNVIYVKIDATEIGAGIESFEKVSCFIWKINFHADGASGGAVPGPHRLLITARSANTSALTYTYADVFLNPLPAPEDVTPEWLNFGTEKIVYNNNRIVTARRNYAIDIFDASDGANPTWASYLQIQYDEPEVIYDLAMAGERVYAVDEHNGLHVADISNIYEPEYLGTIAVSSPNGVEIGKGYVFVHDGYQGNISVFDTTPPGLPEFVSTFHAGSAITSIVFYGGYLYYVLDETKLLVASIDNEGNLEYVGMLDNQDMAFEKLTGYGNYLFCWKSVIGPDLFYAIDISDPENPDVTCIIKINFHITTFCIQDGYAYLVDQIPDSTQVRVVDVHNPDDMQQFYGGSLKGYVNDIISGEGFIYTVQEEPSAIAVYNLDDPEDPDYVTRLDKTAAPNFLALTENYTYAQDDAVYIKILKTTHPESAEIVRVLYIPGGMPGSTMRMVIDGDVGCVLRGKYFEPYEFRTIDLEDPEQAEMAAHVEDVASCDPQALDAAGGYAYVGGNNGWAVVDIDPAYDAHTVASFTFPTGIKAVRCNDEILYLLSYNRLMAVDVSDPWNLQFLGMLDLPDWEIVGFDAIEGCVYISVDSPSRLYVIDATDPENMAISDSADYPFTAGQIHIMGGYLHTASKKEGIGVFNIFPPGTIEPYSNIWTLPFFSADYVACRDGYIYFSSRGDWQAKGLRIYRWW